MTAKDFRKIALSLPETEERSHMNHPDFRVAGKIFATLGYPDKTRAMVKLSPEDQQQFLEGLSRASSRERRLGTPRRHQRCLKAAEKDIGSQSHPSRLAQHRPEALAEEENLDLTRSEPPVGVDFRSATFVILRAHRGCALSFSANKANGSELTQFAPAPLESI